jgi:hypothetical protein
MKSLFSVPTARLLCFSSSLCSTLAQINPLPGTGIVLRQKIKTMLKLPLFVTLCGVLLINSLPAAAHSGGSGASGSLVSGSDMVSLVRPGRQMRKFVNSYIKDNDEELAEVRERSSQPFLIIDSVMDHYDLPQELRYLAVIESELRPMALSRVGARGPWQLMAATARDLGLKVSRRSDERTNYYKSTRAAALYLRDLHREFSDWLLVLAAYNAGPGPVYRAMRLAGSRNFWALERYLPAETRQHVRRFIATAYYFAISGPVIDPVPVAPEAVQHGFPGYYAAVEGGAAGIGGQNAGLSGMGLSDGALVGMGQTGVAGDGLAPGFAGDEQVVLAGLGSGGVWRKEGLISFGRRSGAVVL